MVGNMVRGNTKQEITYVIQTIGEGPHLLKIE
jgi:hypothetical protein